MYFGDKDRRTVATVRDHAHAAMRHFRAPPRRFQALLGTRVLASAARALTQRRESCRAHAL